ncbi:hypothetical protein NE235_26330 [Actinoallomurus spadix]|uniref:Uncharacterized protein n=1 Tax=Actinoallomurus spadix TaxID=79912 RepID=A0ABN0WY53_9ACTN|nr:hypothetical protein [Actinoallomurus spadix]MCO5989631.1 hypothetical protein [Actinoallomurus spadix]
MLAGAGAAALALGIGAGTAHAATPAWQISQLTAHYEIHDLTIAPTGSAWAVGERTKAGKTLPVVQHLSGTTWKDVTVPATWKTPLKVVDASSSKNVWAFGEDGSIAHWNGKKWSSAKFGGGFHPTDAAAIGASDVWAVNGTTARHWNGKKWATVKLPARVGSIHAVSGKNIWAAGSIGMSKAAVIHWNGKAWKVAKTVSLPKPDEYADISFMDVTVSGKSVWAVGSQSWSCGVDGDDVCYKPLVLRLTGSKAKTFVASKGVGYTKVAADGSGGAWLLQGAWSPKFVHVTGDTFTSAAAPQPAHYDVNLTTLKNRAGTKTIWSAGGSFPQGDPDDPTGQGIYLRNG